MLCASGNAGAIQVKVAAIGMPRRRATNTPDTTPKRMPPQMPSPPCQILTIANRSLLNFDQSVITWYKRAPTMPIGTAIIAIELMSSRVPMPRFSTRRPANHTAAITPSAIIIP